MQKKYEELFYEFEPHDITQGDYIHSPYAYFRGEKDIPGAMMHVGFQVFTKPVKLEPEPHFHREEEYLVFHGAVLPDTFASFDAEVHFYLGKSRNAMEKIVVTEPTIIRIPRGYWHSPLNFVRVDKPVLFQAVLLAGKEGKLIQRKGTDGQILNLFSDNSCLDQSITDIETLDDGLYTAVPWEYINEDGIEQYSKAGSYDSDKAPDSRQCVVTKHNTSKPYSDATSLLAPKPALTEDIARCVLAFPKEKTTWGDWCPSPQAYFRGETYMEDSGYHVGWQILKGANDMEDIHFHQGADEYIFFMGGDPMNIFDFDAEIEFFFGDDPFNLESKIITKPTVVRVPANYWHCPIKFRKMKKPLIFQAAYLSGTWGTIKLREDQSVSSNRTMHKGLKEYEYMGDNVRLCKYDMEKRCNICGECIPDQTVQE